MKLLLDRIESPMGTIVLITNGDRLCALDFADYHHRTLNLLHKRYQSIGEPRSFDIRSRSLDNRKRDRVDLGLYGAIAQLVEHLHGMQGVSGSNPLGSI